MMDFGGIKELTIGEVKVKELFIGGVKVWQSGRLPAGYTELEYIEATGTQYIDTGITGRNGLSVEFSFNPLSLLSADSSTIIGCTNGSNQRMYLTMNKTPAPKFYWELGASNYHVETSGARAIDGTKYHINISWTKARSVLTVDGKAVITINTLAFDDNKTNLYLFARNKGTSVDKYSHARLYGMKMWDNGTLVRDFVPARSRDGTVGMYDLVTGGFFTNAGTDSFTAGGAV